MKYGGRHKQTMSLISNEILMPLGVKQAEKFLRGNFAWFKIFNKSCVYI